MNSNIGILWAEACRLQRRAMSRDDSDAWLRAAAAWSALAAQCHQMPNDQQIYLGLQKLACNKSLEREETSYDRRRPNVAADK
jgi:hypothetical protein